MSTTTAIDLGSYTLKIVSGQSGSHPKVERVVELFNGVGVSLPIDERSKDGLVQLLGNAMNDYKIPREDVRLALPEAAVSTKVIEMPPLSDAELSSAIQWQAEQHIPIPVDELSLEYQVLYRPPRGQKGEQMRVLLVGSRKKVIESYLEVFYQVGIEPVLLETQVLSTLRSLQFTPQDPATLVVTMGASSTDMAVVDQGELAFVYTFGQGGQLATRTIVQTLQQETKAAEEYKRQYGLDPQALGGKLREVLMPVIDNQVQEVRKALQFFATARPTTVVGRVVLCGGAATLPGLVQHMAEAMSVEVLLGAAFGSASGEIPPGAATQYSVCMGLMMRDLSA